MRLCNEAIYVLILSIIILTGDVYIFGVGISNLVNVLIGLTFIIATNCVCKNPSFRWYVWLVLIGHIILSVGTIILMVNSETNPEIQKIIATEKKYRNDMTNY